MTHRSTLTRLCCALLLALACSCSKKANNTANNENNVNASLPDGTAVSLELRPGTLMLTEVGESARLEVVFLDEDGERVRGDASFATSDADVVEVDEDGTVTAQALGSARITVSAGDLTTAGIVYVATPAAGVVLVDASHIVDGPYATDDDPLSLEYGVTLSDLELSEGDILWATDDTPVAGRVISVTENDDGVATTLELVPIEQIFDALELRQTFELDEVVLNPEVIENYEVVEEDGALVFAAKPSFMPGALGTPMGTFAYSSLFGCETNVAAFPLSAGAVPVFGIQRSFSFEVDYTSSTGLRKLAMTGFTEAKLEIKPQITAQVEAKATCDLDIFRLPIPIGGPLAFFFGGAVQLGVGFEIGAKLTAASFGFEAAVSKRVDFELGLQCTDGNCEALDTVTPQPAMTSSKLVLPNFSQQARAEMDLFVYGFAKPSFGPPLLSQLQFTPFQLRAGVKTSANMATAYAQAADDSYRSEYKLDGLVEFGTTLQFENFLGLLDLNLAQFTLSDTLPVSASPSAPPDAANPGGELHPLTVPSTVAPGVALQGTIELDPGSLTYLGIDNVSAVVVARVTADDVEEIARVPGVAGQSSYTFEWTPGAEHLGAQTLAVFVETTLSGPFLLELAKDSRRTVVVGDRTAILVSGDDGTAPYGDIFAVDPETGELTRLTNDDGLDVYPVWSGDRSQIFFISNRDGPTRVYRMHADGTNVEPVLPVLTNPPDTPEEFAISPDGSQIAYVSDDELWLAPTNMSAAARNLTDGMNVEDYGGVTWPFFSRDGAEISMAFGAFDDDWIGVVDVAGTTSVGTVTTADNDVQPHWNSAGEVLGAEWQSANNVALFYTSIAGGRTTILTGYADYETYRWLPDGQRVVFVGYDPAFTPTLYVTTRTGQVTTLHAGLDRITMVAPSPDGRSIAYAGRMGTRFSVWVVDLETQTPMDLVPDFLNAGSVAW